jgi:hypothetical protein
MYPVFLIEIYFLLLLLFIGWVGLAGLGVGASVSN